MTERKPPARARLDGERMFHLLMENVKDFAIFMLDPEGRIVSWNTGAERILGYKEPEIIGQPFGLIFTPEDVQRKRPEYELQLAKEAGRAEDERWHIRKEGSRLWASGVVTPLMNENGQLQGFAKILRDITERKLAEERLAEANQRKDEFLAMLAHELRNPLAPILNVMQIFKREGDGQKHLKEATGMVERALGRIVRIVDDLLDVSRITRGKVQLRKERLSLQTAVQQAVKSVRPFVESRQAPAFRVPAPGSNLAGSRPCTHRAGSCELAEQCGQVHGTRREDLAYCRAAGQRLRADDQGQWHRHLAGNAAPHL